MRTIMAVLFAPLLLALVVAVGALAMVLELAVWIIALPYKLLAGVVYLILGGGKS